MACSLSGLPALEDGVVLKVIAGVEELAWRSFVQRLFEPGKPSREFVPCRADARPGAAQHGVEAVHVTAKGLQIANPQKGRFLKLLLFEPIRGRYRSGQDLRDHLPARHLPEELAHRL
ncbi:MAG: hypothetical protein ACRD1R_20385 [Acidobacteriota bacterium]